MSRKQAIQVETTQTAAVVAGVDVHAQLRALVGVARLDAVDIVQVAAGRKHVDRPVGAMSAPQEWTIAIGPPQYQFPTVPSSDGAAILVSVTAQCTDGGETVFAEIQVQARVQYAFVGLASAPPPEVLKKFGDDVGIHHAWPYLRDRVQTLSQWLGLPPVVLPLRKR